MFAIVVVLCFCCIGFWFWWFGDCVFWWGLCGLITVGLGLGLCYFAGIVLFGLLCVDWFDCWLDGFCFVVFVCLVCWWLRVFVLIVLLCGVCLPWVDIVTLVCCL